MDWHELQPPPIPDRHRVFRGAVARALQIEPARSAGNGGVLNIVVDNLHNDAECVAVDEQTNHHIVPLYGFGEADRVLRANRLLRVRGVRCVRSIFCIVSFPTVCCSGGRCR